MKSIIVLFCLLFTSISYSNINPRDHAYTIKADINNGQLKKRTIEALDNMIRTGSDELRKKHHDNDADRIMQDWLYNQRAFILDRIDGKDLGDHKRIEWLYQVWFKIDSTLGHTLTIMLHLDDIYDFSYAIPVVFSCVDNVDSPEFLKHYTPFLGGLGYWTAYITCMVMAEIPVSFICSPLAVIVEDICRIIVAPATNDFVWGKSCQ
jgi:hypothetical protein